MRIRAAQRPKQIECSHAVIQEQIPVKNIGLGKNPDCPIGLDETSHAANADGLGNVVGYIAGAAEGCSAKYQRKDNEPSCINSDGCPKYAHVRVLFLSATTRVDSINPAANRHLARMAKLSR
ncbi:MAG: hypothetical protein ABSG03_07435 [Bryobacteraceae bacterium]